jgi:hypothetical protein
MSPQPSLFRSEIVVFLRQMTPLLRHFNERNLPANLLVSLLGKVRQESTAEAF